MMIGERFPARVEALLGLRAGRVLDLGSVGLSADEVRAGAPYDTVVSIGVLGEVDDLDAIVTVLAEVLAPDGRLLFAELEPKSARWGRAPSPDVRAALWRNGFTVVDARPWRRRRTPTVIGGVARLTPAGAVTRS